jgi:HSP20 family protein
MAQEIKKPDAGNAPARRYTEPFAAMRSEIDRVFDSFLGRDFGGFSSPVWRIGGASMSPSIDIRESDTEIAIEAELPGMDEKDVSVTLGDGVLTLKGEKKAEREEKKDDYQLTERSYGSFQRSFRIPDSADPDKVTARFDKGVLTVTLAKRPEAVKAEKRIPIGKA